MISRRKFDSITYKQTNDLCIIASYAVAMSAFTGQFEIDNYLSGYNKNFNLLYSDFEFGYLKDFHPRSMKMAGNKIIQSLHNESLQPVFINSRSKCNVEYILDGKSEADRVVAALKSDKKVLANIFLNESHHKPVIPNGHSITVGFDTEGMYMYDVNHAKVMTVPFTSINQFGEIGDTLLFTEK